MRALSRLTRLYQTLPVLLLLSGAVALHAERPEAGGVASIGGALEGLKEPARRLEAARWLAGQPLDLDRQPEVARALDPLPQADPANAPVYLDALAAWADRDSVAVLVKLTENPAVRRSPDHLDRLLDLLASFCDERAAAALVRELYGARAERAQRALEALGAQAEKELLPHFNEPSAPVRERVRTLLLNAGVSEDRVWGRVLTDLRGADIHAREVALAWVARRPPEAARRKTVLEALDPLLGDRGRPYDKPDPKLTPLAELYLRWVEPKDVPALARLGEHHRLTPKVRHRAIELLGETKDPRALDALLPRLNERDERPPTIRALLRLGAPAEKELQRRVAEPPGTDSFKEYTREVYIEALAAFPGHEQDVLNLALEDLKSSNLTRAGNARARLEKLPVQADRQAEVVKAIREHQKRPGVSGGGSYALLHWARAEDVPDVLALLKAKNEETRVKALAALRRLKDERAIEPLVAHLNSDGRESWLAGEALIAIGPACEAAVLAELKKTAGQPAPARPRAACLQILAAVGSVERTVPVLEEMEKAAREARAFAHANHYRTIILRIKERR